MADVAQDQVTVTLDSRVVEDIVQAQIQIGSGSGAPVLSAQIPAPGSVVAPPVILISFEVD